MSKDFFYKDDSGVNFSCKIKSFNPYKFGEVILTHNGQDYIFFANLKNIYVNMMSNIEQVKFLTAFTEHCKDKIFSALYQEDKPTNVDLSLTSENMKPLKKELQEFSRKYLLENRKRGNTYEVILKDITPENVIVKDSNNEEYSFKLDLMDTYFYEYSEEERRKITNYAKNIIKVGEKIRITEQGQIGLTALIELNIGYQFKESLNDKIRDLIKPYQNKTLYGNVFYALVSKVIDGDTIEIFNGDKRERIRLDGIDCPEKKQAFGEHAKSALHNLVKNRRIKIQYTKEEKFGRILGTLYSQEENWSELNINKKLVEEGYALSSNNSYQVAEKKAKDSKKGIWAINFQRPDHFRKNNKFFKKH